jgi:hypothetical protein
LLCSVYTSIADFACFTDALKKTLHRACFYFGTLLLIINIGQLAVKLLGHHHESWFARTYWMFGIVMKQQFKNWLLKATAMAATLIAIFMTMPSYAHNDAEPSPRFWGEGGQKGLTEIDAGTFPGGADARVVRIRDGTGWPETLNRIAAIAKSEEQSVSGCSK